MEVLKVVLVDDEPLALELLSSMIEPDPQVRIVKRCRNGREALAALLEVEVDLVFLDIQMPGVNGFDVIKQIQSDVMPMIIFATAHDEYALDAFDLHAVDYLLKPFDPARARLALARAKERFGLSRANGRVGGLGDKGAIVNAIGRLSSSGLGADVEQDAAHIAAMGRLPIKDGQETHLVELDDIAWVDAAGDYMCVHTNLKTHILRSTMKALKEKLPAHFARVHRSTIVNLTKVNSATALPKGEYSLHIDGGTAIKVSRNYRDAVQGILK